MVRALLKEGLYYRAYDVTFGVITYTVWELFSENGWCFYDLAQPENYDEDGRLLPPENRVYAQYMKMRADEKRLAELICVPVEDGYEIVSVPPTNNI